MAVVSVLIPVYNVEKYLQQCLDSIQKQTLKDIEIICVDDGSTDRSGRILDAYAKEEPRLVVIHKANSGYGKTMNAAMQRATGEYIAIVESDDFAEPFMLQRLYENAKQNNADIVKGNNYDYIAGQRKPANRLKEYKKEQVFSIQEAPAVLEIADTIWSCMYRRNFLLENHIWFHETSGASFQDISFSIQGWIYAKRIYFIDEYLLNYRIDNPDSSMHNPHKIFCVFEEYHWLEEKLKAVFKTDKKIEKYFIGTKHRDYRNHYFRITAPYRYAFLLRWSQEIEEDMAKGRVEKNAFQTEAWKAVSEIHEDWEMFFQNSMLMETDSRLAVCNFKNKEAYKKGLLNDLAMYPEIIIYGAGKVGKETADKLLKNEIPVFAFAVTQEKKEDNYKNIPVLCIQKLVKKRETAAIIIAVTEQNQYEIYRNLEKMHFKNLYRTDPYFREME